MFPNDLSRQISRLTVFSSLVGALYIWHNRQYLNADGLSYLDMALAAPETGGRSLVNLLWSPLYPAFLSSLLAVFKPGPDLRIPLVQTGNIFIFCLSSICFGYLLLQWIRALNRETNQAWESGCFASRSWLAFAYGLFLWESLVFDRPYWVTPDRIVACVVFLVAALLIQIQAQPQRFPRYLLLGILLAIGYFAKAALLPLGLALVAILYVWGRVLHIHGVAKGCSLALIGLLLTCFPWVALLSLESGRLTPGDVAKLNYWWYACYPENRWIGWQGLPAGSGVPVHPPHTLLQRPLTMEFAGPIRGTYPLWYDPAYWHDGIQSHFDFSGEAAAVLATLRNARNMLAAHSVLFAGLATLVLMAGWRRQVAWLLARYPWMVIWPIIAVALYCLVYIEERFVLPFFVIGWLAAFGPPLPDKEDDAARWPVFALVGLALALPALTPVPTLGLRAARDVFRLDVVGSSQQLAAARSLVKIGISPGDKIAMIGEAYVSFFANLAGMRVVAQIVPGHENEYWRLDSQAQQEVHDALQKAGVQAIVTDQPAVIANRSMWTQLADSPYFALRLGLPEVTEDTQAPAVAVTVAPQLQRQAREPSATLAP